MAIISYYNYISACTEDLVDYFFENDALLCVKDLQNGGPKCQQEQRRQGKRDLNTKRSKTGNSKVKIENHF